MLKHLRRWEGFRKQQLFEVLIWRERKMILFISGRRKEVLCCVRN